MKISDTELLKVIWSYQITNLPKKVIQHYMDGSIGVCDFGGVLDDDFWYISSSSICPVSRHKITDKIGPQQILKRVRRLISDGKLKIYSKHIPNFYIDNEKAREAYRFARQWWIDHGVPFGIENRCCKTTMIDEQKFNDMADELKAELIERFCRQSFEQTT